MAELRNKRIEEWEKCLAIIRKNLNNDTAFSTWFEPTEARSLRGNQLILRLPSMFCQELYDKQYRGVILKALDEVFGQRPKVIYEVPVVSNTKGGSIKVDSSLPKRQSQKEKSTGSNKSADNGKRAPEPTESAGRPEPPDSDWFMPKLNGALSFENYCVGSSNKLPWTIAESIARQPVNSIFNPFFLYGDVGVGKTHLMQAIGLHVKQTYPDKRVVFLPMKEFQRLYQNAYLSHKIPAFLQWFIRCDLLLFDDLQEIASSEGTLNNALFPIFNHLHQRGKQLVFTCDRPPHELKELEDRLIDRFKWGIIEKLEKPDPALRKKILSFKARKNGLSLPQDVIDYIAGSPLNSVREIEGIVLRIMTRAINLGLDIDLPLAKAVVADSVKPSVDPPLNFDMIVEEVAEKYRLNPDVIFSKSRVKDVAEARMMIMYRAHKELGLSTGSIGRKLGRKHSTVIHGIRKMEETIEG